MFTIVFEYTLMKLKSLLRSFDISKFSFPSRVASTFTFTYPFGDDNDSYSKKCLRFEDKPEEI